MSVPQKVLRLPGRDGTAWHRTCPSRRRLACLHQKAVRWTVPCASMLPTLIFVMSLVAQGTSDSAQKGTISGHVRDAQGAALAAATLEIECGQIKRRTVTSAVGDFTQSELPLGRCAVTAMSDSFEPETVYVDSGAGRPLNMVLQVRRFASEVVVTPGRGVDERALLTPEALSVVSRRDIETRPYVLLPQVLREEPGVLLQQTTSGQTSPILRGFTGQSNVYLLDGVRLNTGQWRSGPNQYTAWVDSGPVDTIEVVRGGGSVQYGSDALGGTIQFLTSPTLISPRASWVNGNLEVVAGSAAQNVGGEADLGFQTRGASIRVGATRQHVGNLRAGKGLDSHSAITRYFGLPSTLVGTRMPDTGFNQSGAYAVGLFSLGAHGTLRTTFMHESQTDASRYDRVLGGQGVYRSGFDPQALDFGLVRYARTDVGLLDGFSSTFSVNRQADGRYEQARPHQRLDRQEATTTAIGYQVQGHRDFSGRHQFVVGGELYDESIDAFRELVDAARTEAARPDIPDGTTYRSYGVFAQHRIDVAPDRLSLKGGLRFSGFRFATTRDDTLGVTREQVDAHTTTFQAAAVLNLMRGINLTASVNRAFRAANAADLGGIGLTGGGGFEISPTTAASLGAYVGTTAATGAISTGERVQPLRPEVVYQYEAGLKAAVGGFSGSLTAFDLELYDFLQRRALVFDASIVGTAISGFTVVRVDDTGLAYIAQDVRPIATSVNVDRARIRGFETEGKLRVNGSLTLSAYSSMANGRILPDGEHVRRMPPPMGGAKIRWSRSRWWTEAVATFAARQTRLNSGDLGDARIGAIRTRSSIAAFFSGTATDMGLVRDGTLIATGETLAQVQNRVLGSATSAPLFTAHPGFVVFGMRGGVRLTAAFDLTVLGENLTDVNYRLYGSGVDAPGFNVQARMRYRF